MELHRNYNDQIISIFIPTFLLWFLAYLTTFLEIVDLSNKSRISVTLMLVVISLMGSTRYDIPKTSYLKYIDLWFLWYIMNVFCIICHHIIIERFDTIWQLCRGDKNLVNVASTSGSHRIGQRLRMGDARDNLNRCALILFPVITAIFNLIYFKATM